MSNGFKFRIAIPSGWLQKEFAPVFRFVVVSLPKPHTNVSAARSKGKMATHAIATFLEVVAHRNNRKKRVKKANTEFLAMRSFSPKTRAIPSFGLISKKMCMP